jgi:hypothetical protein
MWEGPGHCGQFPLMDCIRKQTGDSYPPMTGRVLFFSRKSSLTLAAGLVLASFTGSEEKPLVVCQIKSFVQSNLLRLFVSIFQMLLKAERCDQLSLISLIIHHLRLTDDTFFYVSVNGSELTSRAERSGHMFPSLTPKQSLIVIICQ